MQALSPAEALIYTMVITSAADRDMSDAELHVMGEVVRTLPIFRELDNEHVMLVGRDCARLLEEEDGLHTVLDAIHTALSRHLSETAYALACEVAAVDLKISPEESRMLEMIRDKLELDRLVAAAIERAVRARYMSS